MQSCSFACKHINVLIAPAYHPAKVTFAGVLENGSRDGHGGPGALKGRRVGHRRVGTWLCGVGVGNVWDRRVKLSIIWWVLGVHDVKLCSFLMQCGGTPRAIVHLFNAVWDCTTFTDTTRCGSWVTRQVKRVEAWEVARRLSKRRCTPTNHVWMYTNQSRVDVNQLTTCGCTPARQVWMYNL